MLKKLICFMVLLFPLLTKAEEAVWLRGMRDCFELISIEAFQTCARIIKSRELLEHAHPKLIADKNGTVTSREVVLIAWDKSDEPHTIYLTMPLRPKRGEKFNVIPTTPGYTIERIRGMGPFKLEFRVTEISSGEELQVYGGKHVWIPNTHAREWSHRALSKVAEEKQYLPFLDHLYHPELVEWGQRYLEAMVKRALAELAFVPSRAFPGWVLNEAYPPEMVLNLVMSEQSDPYRLFDTSVPVSLPRSSYLLGVLVEMAVHGPRAFSGLCSHAYACGWTQFTNKPVPKFNYPGTYTHTYNTCRSFDKKPTLLASFEAGTLDPLNALKAAVCYLDIENASLPKEARAEYLRDPKRGSIYMLTAYNAGGGWSKRVFEKVQSVKKKVRPGEEILHHEQLPKILFYRGEFYNHETHWYIKKYLWVWELLFNDREILVPGTRPPHD